MANFLQLGPVIIDTDQIEAMYMPFNSPGRFDLMTIRTKTGYEFQPHGVEAKDLEQFVATLTGVPVTKKK